MQISEKHGYEHSPPIVSVVALRSGLQFTQPIALFRAREREEAAGPARGEERMLYALIGELMRRCCSSDLLRAPNPFAHCTVAAAVADDYVRITDESKK